MHGTLSSIRLVLDHRSSWDNQHVDLGESGAAGGSLVSECNLGLNPFKLLLPLKFYSFFRECGHS